MVREKIQRALEQRILHGLLAPGAHIIEQDVAREFGVSRGPVRDALRALEKAGLVESVPNRGVFVRRASIAEVKALFDIRVALTDVIAEEAVNNVSNAQISALCAQVEAMEALSHPARVDEYLQANVRFHFALFSLADNRRAAELDLNLGNELLLYRRRGLISGGGLERSNAEHRLILDALAARDAGRFAIEFKHHVAAGRDRFLHSVAGTSSPPSEPVP